MTVLRISTLAQATRTLPPNRDSNPSSSALRSHRSCHPHSSPSDAPFPPHHMEAPLPSSPEQTRIPTDRPCATGQSRFEGYDVFGIDQFRSGWLVVLAKAKDLVVAVFHLGLPFGFLHSWDGSLPASPLNSYCRRQNFRLLLHLFLTGHSF